MTINERKFVLEYSPVGILHWDHLEKIKKFHKTLSKDGRTSNFHLAMMSIWKEYSHFYEASLKTPESLRQHLNKLCGHRSSWNEALTVPLQLLPHSQAFYFTLVGALRLNFFSANATRGENVCAGSRSFESLELKGFELKAPRLALVSFTAQERSQDCCSFVHTGHTCPPLVSPWTSSESVLLDVPSCAMLHILPLTSCSCWQAPDNLKFVLQ